MANTHSRAKHTHTRTYTHIHARTHARAYARSCTRIHTHTHTHKHTHTHTHMCTHTHTHTHAHEHRCAAFACIDENYCNLHACFGDAARVWTVQPDGCPSHGPRISIWRDRRTGDDIVHDARRYLPRVYVCLRQSPPPICTQVHEHNMPTRRGVTNNQTKLYTPCIEINTLTHARAACLRICARTQACHLMRVGCGVQPLGYSHGGVVMRTNPRLLHTESIPVACLRGSLVGAGERGGPARTCGSVRFSVLSSRAYCQVSCSSRVREHHHPQRGRER
jgi:hypothetical protein